MEKRSITYYFIYKNKGGDLHGWKPNVYFKIGDEDETEFVVPGHCLGQEYYMTRLVIPADYCQYDDLIQFGLFNRLPIKQGPHKEIRWKCSSNALQFHESDMVVYMDGESEPTYIPMEESWNSTSAIVMNNSDIDSFAYEITKAPRIYFGNDKCMALINNIFLERMLKWGTWSGTYRTVPKQFFQKWFRKCAEEKLQDILQQEIEEENARLELLEKQRVQPRNNSNIFRQIYIRMRKIVRRNTN